jgi:hypothetical protein
MDTFVYDPLLKPSYICLLHREGWAAEVILILPILLYGCCNYDLATVLTRGA